MEDWLIALIVILIVHYFCAIFTIWLLLKDKLVAGKQIKKAPLVLWNLLVLFVPILGPAIYLICHFAQKKKGGTEAQKSGKDATGGAAAGTETGEAPAAEKPGDPAQKNDEN